MPLTNAYTELDTVLSELGISDGDDDVRIVAAINAASRQIDSYCGRRFWQDTEVRVREYHADDAYHVTVDDISTTDGLVVQIDDDNNGTFATTLTVSTDFTLEPLNAFDRVPSWPYTEIVVTDTYVLPVWQLRPGVRVTARFGWPAIPDDVVQACTIQAKNLYKASSGTFSGFQLSTETGAVMRTPGMDFVASTLLEPYKVRMVG